jgi:hypothetical protein
MRFFVSDIWSKSAEGASCKSHGRNSWLQKSNTFPGFDRKETNRKTRVRQNDWIFFYPKE